MFVEFVSLAILIVRLLWFECVVLVAAFMRVSACGRVERVGAFNLQYFHHHVCLCLCDNELRDVCLCAARCERTRRKKRGDVSLTATKEEKKFAFFSRQRRLEGSVY